MAHDQAHQLIRKMQTDDALRSKLQKAGEQSFTETAQAAGFDVSVEDMQAALRQVSVEQMNQLRPQLPGQGGTSIAAIASVAVI